MRVLEERSRQPTCRSQFLGSVTRRQPSKILDWSRVGLFSSSLVSWVGSESRWTPLIGHVKFSIENVCKLEASYKGQKSSGSWN